MSEIARGELGRASSGCRIDSPERLLLERLFASVPGGVEGFSALAAAALRDALGEPAVPAVTRTTEALGLLLQVIAREMPSMATVEALLAIVQMQYERGAPLESVRVATEAVRAARACGDRKMLRKALTYSSAVRGDIADHTGAVQDAAEAIELASALGDSYSLASTLNNLACSYIYALDYEQAVACLQRALRVLAESSESQDRAERVRCQLFANLGLVAARRDQLTDGLSWLALSDRVRVDWTTPSDCLLRCVHESLHAWLWIRADQVRKAREHCARALDLASRARSERAQLEASIPLALCEVFEGNVEIGVSRLLDVRERAKPWPAFERDTLLALIEAHKRATQPEVALMYLRELMLHTNSMQRERARQRRQMDFLKASSTEVMGGAVPDEMCAREGHLRDQLTELVRSQRRVAASNALLEQLALSAELRDDATGEHPVRVGVLAELLACQCEDEKCVAIRSAACLHDIGKISVPDAILLKPGPLSDGERALMQEHCQMGEELIRQCEVDDLSTAAQVARSHHENWDGSGYPDGLVGDAIPFAARVTALAEAFDALTHARPYRPAISPREALALIAADSGTRFDPTLAERFIALVEKLMTEVDDLDEYLGRSAQQSTFLQARARIAASLVAAESNDSRVSTQAATATGASAAGA